MLDRGEGAPLSVLCLMQTRILVAFCHKVHWPMSNVVSIRTPESFSDKLFFSWVSLQHMCEIVPHQVQGFELLFSQLPKVSVCLFLQVCA